jgi:hypothetical protein
VPWRNGRGVTQEVAAWPGPAEGCVGRVALSRVETDGPFSRYDGYERVLVVTGGAGLVLVHGEAGARVRLRPLEPHRFDGGVDTRAELVDGPVADFNVYARQGLARADVEVLRLARRRAREFVGPGEIYVHVLAGRALARVPREEEPVELAAGDGLLGRELAHEEEWELAGLDATALLLLVRWTPLGPR